jgi:hypothetical protein
MKKSLMIVLGVAAIAVLGLSVFAWLGPRREIDRRQISLSEECKRLQQVISREIKVGDSEEKLRSFFEAQNWDFDYEKRDNTYGARIAVEKKDGMTVHSIIITVALDQNKAVKRIHAVDSFLAP